MSYNNAKELILVKDWTFNAKPSQEACSNRLTALLQIQHPSVLHCLKKAEEDRTEFCSSFFKVTAGFEYEEKKLSALIREV